MGCAVAQTALDVLVNGKMIENSARMGQYFREKLRLISSPHIKEVRGKGLLVGLELKPEAGGGRRFCESPPKPRNLWLRQLTPTLFALLPG